jgi:hypothetical protein
LWSRRILNSLFSKENKGSQQFSSKMGAAPRLPSGVVEIQSEFVIGARIKGSKHPALKLMELAALDSGIVNPSPTQVNMSKTGDLGMKLRAISRTVKGKRRLGLLLPDGVVRVSILAFETLPSKVQEREALLRWRVKDGLGFPPEQATLSYQVTPIDDRLIEVLLIAVKTEILLQYLAALHTIRAGATWILPVTMALLPLLPEAEPGGQLLIHVHSGWVTCAVVTGDRLRFWRTRRLERSGSDSTIDEVVSEAARASASVRDRIGIDAKRVWYCARPGIEDGLQAPLERVTNCPASSLPLNNLAPVSLGSEQQKIFELFGAPVAGLVANGGGSR